MAKISFPSLTLMSSTTWKEIGENWFPVEAYFAQISGTLAESLTIKMNYAIGDDVKGPVIADFPSVELREYLIQKAR